MTEQKQVFIKPATGADGQPLKVRKPDKPLELLEEAGEWVKKSIHWLRRLMDGSVVEAKPPKPEKPAPAKTDTASAAPAAKATGKE